MDHLFSGGTPGFRNHVINMKCKQCNDGSTLAQKYSSVFKKTAVNSERVTHESYIKLISWVALYITGVPKKVLRFDFDNLQMAEAMKLSLDGGRMNLDFGILELYFAKKIHGDINVQNPYHISGRV